MRIQPFLFAPAITALAVASSCASTLYVDPNSPGPIAPYSSWATAATNIQDAVDAANAGDTVLVTNGVYATGGRPWFDSGTNRVTLTNAITLQSVNGPAFTLIVGNQVIGSGPVQTNAVRCVGMGGGAVLSGFTLTNGEAGAGNYPDGGGVANITFGSNTVTNCVLVNNLATNAAGGGAYRVQLLNCELAGNYAEFGGGACNCTLVNCTIASNTATQGGGVYGASPFGNSLLTNCILVGNSASASGGGVYGCTTYNSLLTGNGNTNSTSGGASYSGVLINCTLVGNFSLGLGAADGSTMANSIIYHNSNGAYADCYQCTLTNSCTPVLFPANVNCISNPPVFADAAHGNYRLQIGSPCIDAGTNFYAVGPVDLDGNPRIVGAAVDMGAYENQNTNPVHFVSLSSTNPITPFTSWTTAATNIQDAIDAAVARDYVIVSNGIYNAGGRRVNGYSLTNRVAVTKAVTVQSLNGPGPTIIQGNSPLGASAIRCVYLTNGAALIGFTLTNGATLSLPGNPTFELGGGGILCESTSAVVSNCVMTGNSADSGGAAIGGTLVNCTIFQNSASAGVGGGVCGYNSGMGEPSVGSISNVLYNCIISSNSAEYGGGAYNSVLNGCVLSGNTTGVSYDGGGAAHSVLNGCIITNNSARTSDGGGVSYSTLTNCLLARNRGLNGGGAAFSTLFNCTVASNSGAGVSGSTVYNSIVYDNPSPQNYTSSTLRYCDTTPLPTGAGNIANDPAFVNPAGGDFHLKATSPCINSGDNSYVSTSGDLDGNPRIAAGTVDIGAYEYPTPTSILSYAWAQEFGLPTDGTADYLDLDGTGMENWQKSVAGLNPTNAASVLVMLTPATATNGLTVSWESVGNRMYYLQSATDLAEQPAFSTIQSNLAGSVTGTNSFTDTNAVGQGPYFYRVGVQ